MATTFGATIVRPSNAEPSHLPEALTDSPALTPAVSRDGSDYPSGLAPARSPLYSHSLGSDLVVSHSRAHSDRSIKEAIAVFEKDVESGNVTPLSPNDEQNPFGRNVRVSTNKECEMWPSKQTLKQKRQAGKQQRREKRGLAGFGPVREYWSGLNTRQRLYYKIGMGVFLVGVAVALGVGISIAVKGSYYIDDGSSKTVGGH